MGYRAPVLREIVRQHAEQAAFLYTVYKRHKENPDENPDMDEERLERLTERIKAHLDGVAVAGDEGREIVEELYAEYPEEGEAWLVEKIFQLSQKTGTPDQPSPSNTSKDSSSATPR